MLASACLQVSLLAPANSPSRPRLPCVRNQAVKVASRCEPMVALVHTPEVPELSASRYWCASNTMLLPLSTTCSMACALGVPYQLDVQLWAPDHALPGTATVLVAPVARMRR